MVATQEIHHGTYVVSHIVGHEAPKLHQKNEVPPLVESLFLYMEYLGEIVPGMQVFLSIILNSAAISYPT